MKKLFGIVALVLLMASLPMLAETRVTVVHMPYAMSQYFPGGVFANHMDFVQVWIITDDTLVTGFQVTVTYIDKDSKVHGVQRLVKNTQDLVVVNFELPEGSTVPKGGTLVEDLKVAASTQR